MSCKRDFRWRAISPRPLFFFLFASRSSRSSSRIIDPPLQLEFLTVSAEDLLKTTTAIAVSVLLPRVAKRTVIFRLLNELLSPLSKHTPRVFFPSPSRREGHGVLYGACISVEERPSLLPLHDFLLVYEFSIERSSPRTSP